MKAKMKMTVMVAVMAAAVGSAVATPPAYETYSTVPPKDMIAQTGTPPMPITLPTSPQQVIPPGAPAFDTNGMNFTNVTFKVATGLETVPSGAALGYVQADADLWSLKSVDIGLGGEAALGAYNEGLYSADLDVEVIENLSTFQLVGKLGLGWNFEDQPGAYLTVEADINYNLAAGTGWGFLGNGKSTFTYVGAGVGLQADKFKVSSNGGSLEKVGKIYAGIAF